MATGPGSFFESITLNKLMSIFNIIPVVLSFRIGKIVSLGQMGLHRESLSHRTNIGVAGWLHG